MATKLGSLAEGPSTLGGPFSKLFTSTTLIGSLKDLKDVDAVIFWGGQDISPSLYGEKANSFSEATDTPSKRDILEWSVMKWCVANAVPMIGICRGAQLLCAFDGGKLAQDVGGHTRGHNILTTSKKSFYAPASHHQMMLPKASAQIIGFSEEKKIDFYLGENDTINTVPFAFKEPEVVVFPELRAVGFQFHPEWADYNHASSCYALDTVKEYLL